MNSHRSAVSNDCKLIPAERPFSCFDFVEKHFKGLPSLHRCLSIARTHDLKTILMEAIDPKGIIADENSEIQERYKDHIMSDLYRISFWSSAFHNVDEIGRTDGSRLIGYAIIMDD